MKFLIICTLAITSLNIFSKDIIFKAASFKKNGDLLTLQSKIDNDVYATCAYKYNRTKKSFGNLPQIKIDKSEYRLVSKAVGGSIETTKMGRGLANYSKKDSVNVIRDKNGGYYCHFKVLDD